MSRKRILIIHPGALFPVIMANQVRIIEMAKFLAREHSVDVITLVKTKNQRTISSQESKSLPFRIHLINVINPSWNPLKIVWHGIIFRLLNYFTGLSSREYYWSHPKIRKKILEIAGRTGCDIIQTEYWYPASVFSFFAAGTVCRVIDTHNVMAEKKVLELKGKYGDNIPGYQKRELERYTLREKEVLGSADLLIAISSADQQRFFNIVPDKPQIVIPTGQELDQFTSYPVSPGNHTILFYGGMGSDQNIVAFFRYWKRILPLVRNSVPGVKTLVVGSNPPASIQDLHNGNDVVVTGYVVDVREYLAKATVMILPLELGGGFRTRVVEVMAMGIPVIGTRNALENLEMEDGAQGYITDRDDTMAARVIQVISDTRLRNTLSARCREFVTGKYTLNKTYGKLSAHYAGLAPVLNSN
jgi:glycosyltransferase involved in cell wall biosynthesis